MSEETKFDEILEIYSKPEEHEYVPLGCGHICQVPSIIRDECCQCSNAKKRCNHCKNDVHKLTLEAKRFYCHKHDVPIGMDKYGNCCVCNYKTTTSNKTTFKELKIYQRSPWLKAMRENPVMTKPTFKQQHSSHKCPHGRQYANPFVKAVGSSQKRHMFKKPGVTTLQTIHEFVGLAIDSDMPKRNAWCNIAREMHFNCPSFASDEKKSDDNDVFDRNAITWPPLDQIIQEERSIHDWVIFQKESDTNWETDSDLFSLISESFSESSWVDLATAKKRKGISFVEMLKRKSKNNFNNQLANVKRTHTFTHKHETKIEEPDVAEAEYILGKLKGKHRNRATKNSRKGAKNSRKALVKKKKRSKHSVRRQCL